MAGPMQRVKAIRGFRHKGNIIGPGSVLDLERAQAVELRTVNKIEFVQPDTKPHQTDKLPQPTMGRQAPATDAGKSTSEKTAK